jgi:hypothetical protein
MIEALGSDTNKVSVSGDDQPFSQLLDVMYCRLGATPITMENIESILELTCKYDAAKAQAVCDVFLSQQSLD